MKTGLVTNKLLLKGLEKISEHSAVFTAGVSLAAAAGLRPMVMSMAPGVKKENKQHAIAASILSGAVKFITAAAIAIPIENAVKNTEKLPERFLKPETIEVFKKGAASISRAENFKFITQILKLGSNIAAAVPKSMITAALIPVLTEILFKNKEKRKGYKTPEYLYRTDNTVFNPSFKGKITDAAAKGIGKLLDLKPVQKFADKFSTHSADTARSMAIASDVLLTASFSHSVMKNKKIAKERKKPLILNNIYGTAFSVFGGSIIDEAVKKSSAGFIERFKEIHKNNPKLPKYIEGINTARPALIFAAIYYGLLPFVTLYLADKTSERHSRGIKNLQV